jgi:hypothetical protein
MRRSVMSVFGALDDFQAALRADDGHWRRANPN